MEGNNSFFVTFRLTIIISFSLSSEHAFVYQYRNSKLSYYKTINIRKLTLP